MSNTPPIEQSPDWSTRTRRTVLIILMVLGLVFLWYIRQILPLVVISALFAFLLSPLVNFTANRILRIPFIGIRGRRGWATLIAFGICVVVVTVLILVVAPVLINQVEEFGRNAPALIRSVENELERLLSYPITFGGEPILIDGEELIPLERIAEATGTSDIGRIIRFDEINLEDAAGTFFGSVGSLTGPAFSFVGGAFNTLINITFLLIMSFYLLVDGGMFIQNSISLAPEQYQEDARRLLHQLASVWHAYVRGQILLCVIMGTLVYFAALILGVPNAPILGLLAGILEFIPNLGPLIALIPAALLALVSTSSTIPFLDGFTFMIVVIIVWTMLQNIEAVFLVPRVMGDSLDLHPYVVIIAVLGGAAVAGALGVILAAPTVASMRVIGRYIYRKLMGLAPFVDAPEEPPSPNRLRIPARLESILETIFGRPSAPARDTDKPEPAQS